MTNINKTLKEEWKIGNWVKVIGGNNEIGQRKMLGEIGVIESFGTQYKVKGKDTVEVFVSFPSMLHPETHVFNDYQLNLTPPNN